MAIKPTREQINHDNTVKILRVCYPKDMIWHDYLKLQKIEDQ